jgi:hypothetical protein
MAIQRRLTAREIMNSRRIIQELILAGREFVRHVIEKPKPRDGE